MIAMMPQTIQANISRPRYTSNALGGGEAFRDKPRRDLFALVALNNDQSVLYRSARTAMRLQLTAELFQLAARTDKSFDERNRLPGPLPGIQSYLESLLPVLQAFLGNRLFFRPEVGVGRIHDAIAAGFLLAHTKSCLYLSQAAIVPPPSGSYRGSLPDG